MAGGMAGGHGKRTWQENMAGGHGRWTWQGGMAEGGHGRGGAWQRGGMAGGHGREARLGSRRQTHTKNVTWITKDPGTKIQAADGKQEKKEKV